MNKTLKKIAKRLKKQSVKVPKSWKGKSFFKRADFIKYVIDYVYESPEETIAFDDIDNRWLSSLIVATYPFVLIESHDQEYSKESIKLYYYNFKRKCFCKSVSLFLANLLQYLNVSITAKGLRELILNIEGWAWTGDIPIIDKPDIVTSSF